MRFRVVFKPPVCKGSPACLQKLHSGITVLDRPTHLGPWADTALCLWHWKGTEREAVTRTAIPAPFMGSVENGGHSSSCTAGSWRLSGTCMRACARACVRLFSSFCNTEQSMPGFQRCLLIPTLPRASAWTLTYSSWSQGHRLSVGVMVKGSVVGSGGAGLSSCFALSS